MILFGASGHCKVVLDILLLRNEKVTAILDDNPQQSEIFGVSVQKNHLSENSAEETIISIGNNEVRKLISEKYSNLKFGKAIHPTAVVSVFSDIKEGTVIMAQASVNADTSIGRHCIINTSAVVEHDCHIGDYVHISPNAALAGSVKIGEGTQIGIGASIKQGVEIGKWCTIGAGAVIIKNVPNFATVVGNPGKIIKINKK